MKLFYLLGKDAAASESGWLQHIPTSFTGSKLQGPLLS